MRGRINNWTIDPNLSYTFGMKTAVSLPDEVFAQAERLAKRLRITRSDLYRRAVAEYVARYAPDAVTQALDRLAVDLDGEPDAFAAKAGRRVLEQSEW